MKGKWFLIIAIIMTIAMLMSFSLAGCKTEEAVEEEEEAVEETVEEEVIINFWVNTGDLSWQTEMTEMYSLEKPNVKFNITPMSTLDIMDLAPSSLASGGEDIDLLWIEATEPIQNTMAKEGLLLDLTPYYDQYNWWDQVAEAYIDSTKTPDFGQFFFPTSLVSWPYFFYNKAIFNEVGVEPPEELNDIFLLASKLRDAGYEPIAVGSGWHTDYIMENLWVRFLTEEEWHDFLYWYSDDEISADALKSEGVVEAYTFFKKMVNEGVFQTGHVAMDADGARSLFNEGKAAIHSAGSWVSANIKEEAPEIDFGVFALPKYNSATSIIIYGNNALAVPADISEEKLSVVIDYLDKTISNEYAVTSYNHGQMTYSLNVVSEEIEKVADPITTEIATLIVENGGDLWNGMWWPAPMWDAELITLENIINGTWTVEDAVNHLYDSGLAELEIKQ